MNRKPVPTLKELIARGKELFPLSRSMAHQWVRKSYSLYASGTHRMQMVVPRKKQ